MSAFDELIDGMVAGRGWPEMGNTEAVSGHHRADGRRGRSGYSPSRAMVHAPPEDGPGHL